MGRLIGLQCPQCRENVEGENHSLVFFCRKCSLGFDISAKKTERYSAAFVKPQLNKSYPMVYFPFWCIDAHFKIIDIAVEQETPGKSLFHIPAFFVKHVDTFSDIGFMYYKKKVTLHRDINQGWPVYAANRPAHSAANFPVLYLYKDESEKRGGAKLDIQVSDKRFMLVLIPFFLVEGGYLDSQLGINYPSGVLL